MQVSPDKTEATCPYCKHKFLIQKDPTIEELKEKKKSLVMLVKKELEMLWVKTRKRTEKIQF